MIETYKKNLNTRWLDRRLQPDLSARHYPRLGFTSLIYLLFSQVCVAAGERSAIDSLPSIVSLLFAEDECVNIVPSNTVIFDSFDVVCSSNYYSQLGVTPLRLANYYSFTHLGGPLFIDYLSDSPGSFNPFLIMRSGIGRTGDPVVSEATQALPDGVDDDGHGDEFSSRLIYSALAPGRYTLEATSANLAASSAKFVLSIYPDRVSARASNRLNDTGISFSASSNTNNSSVCQSSVNGLVNQDCNSGRDADLILGRAQEDNDNDGVDGFSFLKVSSTGAPLPESASDWSCVKDNVTGLLWEVKTNDGGLRDMSHSYTWYSDDASNNAGQPGSQDGGECFSQGSSNCDTQGYVAAVNSTGLCGFSTWRLPSVDELIGLVNYDGANPAIDPAFFKNTSNTFFWSSSPVSFRENYAWGVQYDFGDPFGQERSNVNQVRLVVGAPIE